MLAHSYWQEIREADHSRVVELRVKRMHVPTVSRLASTYKLDVERYVGLYTELFYAIIPTLYLCLFADLLSLHLVNFLDSCIHSIITGMFYDTLY